MPPDHLPERLAERPAGDSCANCRHFAKLSPGRAAICFAKWEELPLNAAVPLTHADEWCDRHAAPSLLAERVRRG